MKDVYFNNYKNNKDDTSEIPLTKSEREFQDKINQQKYEQIVKKQNRDFGIEEYDDILSSFDDVDSGRNERRQRRSEQRPTQSQHSRSAPHSSNSSNNKKKKKKKRRGCGCGTFLICFLLIIALACGGSFGYIYSLCEKTNYVPAKNITSNSSLMSSPDVYNVLLLGTDKDEYETSRSDTMMLVSLDKKNKKIKFTSFMRDMWVDIPENGEAKLNAAFAYGGAPLVEQTIEENFKIKIDNYVMVDFEMFKKLIDGLGGVTVDITESEAEFINRTSHAKVTPGKNTLNGDYALIYCRIRKLDSDFMRTQRQRKVMSAILAQLKSQNVLNTLSVMSDILPLITTDISPMDMTKRIFTSTSLLKYDNDQLRIPQDGMYISKTVHGQDALVPDLDANINELQTFIYG